MEETATVAYSERLHSLDHCQLLPVMADIQGAAPFQLLWHSSVLCQQPFTGVTLFDVASCVNCPLLPPLCRMLYSE